VEIEGIPSVRLGLDVTGSFVQNKTITERSPTPGDYLATVIPAIQAIPATVDGPPGILEMQMPQFHWKPDMRL
jgi:2,4-diaminopentanoate dehydrogenase